MSKTKFPFSNPAFQKTETSATGQFNLVSNTSSLNAVFDFRPLDIEESQKIDSLLKDNASDVTTSDQLLEDARKLKECTAEIKAIGKQGVVLTGERIHRAREILKPYRDGTFMRWLDIVMPSRKTGYNALAYYELYEALPQDDTRDKFTQISQKPAYILASRDCDIKKKIELIKKAKGMGADELVTLIQEEIPSAQEDKRAVKGGVIGKAIYSIRNAIHRIRCNTATLTKADISELRQIRDLIDELIP